jgi:hypothetical protein
VSTIRGPVGTTTAMLGLEEVSSHCATTHKLRMICVILHTSALTFPWCSFLNFNL